MNIMSKLLTVKQFCEYFQIAESTFYKWKREGIVRPLKVGGNSYISEEEIERIIKSAQESVPPPHAAEAN